MSIKIFKERQSVRYWYELDNNSFLTILKGDEIFDTRHCLYSVLRTIDGIDDVEYDSHFGPGLSIVIEANKDTSAIHDKIKQAIIEFVA